MAMSLLEGDDEIGDVMVEMNTTPLIDVMLVLLIMLIITIPIQTHAVKLNMPTPGASAGASEAPRIIEVSVTGTGDIAWNGVPVANRQELESRIAAEAKEEPQPEFHIRPDRGAKYSVVAMIMASAQRLGLDKIGLTGNEQFIDY